MKMSDVLFIGKSAFPNDRASAVRVYTLAKLFSGFGFTPYLVGMDAMISEDRLIKNGQYHEFEFYNISVVSKHPLDVIGINCIVKKETEKLIAERNVKYIVVTCLEGVRLTAVLSVAKKHKIPVIGDIVEWYDRGDFHGIRNFIKLLRNRITLVYLNPKIKNILAISSLLGDYYTCKKCNVQIIPSIIDKNEYSENVFCRKHNDDIVFAYAGSPGTKDSVVNFISAAARLSSSGVKNFKIKLFGTTKDNLLRLGCLQGELDELGDMLVCSSHIPHGQVKVEISKADFTLLVRPDRRSSHAGFPTKLSESFACGTPVIANLTSDIGLYLHDNENSVICQSNSTEECKTAIEKILLMSDEHLASMKIAAKNTSKRFDYLAFKDKLQLFLSRIEK